jgi:hypothetical protein
VHFLGQLSLVVWLPLPKERLIMGRYNKAALLQGDFREKENGYKLLQKRDRAGRALKAEIVYFYPAIIVGNGD